MPSLSILVVSSIVAAMAYLAVIACGAVVFALRLGGRREDTVDALDAQSSSRFTIPVSVIVPLSPRRDDSGGPVDAPAISRTIRSAVAFDYPEFEVIVAAEELSDETWAALKAEWQLEPREYFYRQTLPSQAVWKVYRSARERRLMIVDKAPSASRADAVNCGVNLAHFRYVTAIDAGVTFAPDALLRAMAAPLRDPAGVAGATSHIEVADGMWQPLPSVRSILRSRIAASVPAPSLLRPSSDRGRSRDAALSLARAVVVWRRDAIVQLGGFSTTAADADVDMAIRVGWSSKIAGRVVRSAEIFGRTAEPSSAVRLRMTTRRQRAALEAIRQLWTSGADGRRTLALTAMSDVLTPFAQAWVVGAAIASAAAGWILWRDAAAAVVLLSIGRAAVSAAALLARGSAPGAPDAASLSRLLLMAPLEFFAAGPIAVAGRAAGFWAAVRS